MNIYHCKHGHYVTITDPCQLCIEDVASVLNARVRAGEEPCPVCGEEVARLRKELSESYQAERDMEAALETEREECTQAQAACGRRAIEITKLRADLAAAAKREAGLREALEEIAEADCAYGDGCPRFGTRHGQCVGCKAREALGEVEHA